jgi:hypothetical protein
MNWLARHCLTCLLAVLPLVSSRGLPLAPIEPPPELLGLFVQPVSGGVMEFRRDGSLAGWPLEGTWRMIETDRIEFKAKGELTRAELKVMPDHSLRLTPLNAVGVADGPSSELLRLKPASLDIKKRMGFYLIRHMRAAENEASLRPAKLAESGHFQTVEGGFYFRLVPGKEVGTVFGYASDRDDETLAVNLYEAGACLVVFDRLYKPNLFASCLKGEDPAPSAAKK